MRLIRQITLILTLVFIVKCSNTSGPSCTVWTNSTCYDYAGTTWSYQHAAEQLCSAVLGFWSTDGCSYSNCDPADANGQIECTE